MWKIWQGQFTNLPPELWLELNESNSGGMFREDLVFQQTASRTCIYFSSDILMT